MPKGSTFAADLLKLIFNATAIANVANNATTSPLTSLYIALHSADPGVGGSQTTSELAYTGYARQAVARSTSGFTVTGTSVKPNANVDFPASTAGTPVATHFSIGTAATGTGKILYSGAISPSMQIITTGVNTLTSNSTVTES